MSFINKFLMAAFILGASLWAWHSSSDLETAELTDSLRETNDLTYKQLSEGSVHYVLEMPSLQNSSTDSKKLETVVLVHGFSVPSYVWENTSKWLSSGGYRVLRFDLYGRGYSDRPEIDYNIDLFVDQLRELLEQLEIEEAIHLVGLSMGGPISTRFSHQFPSKVKSLSLLAPLVETPDRIDLKLLAIPGIGEYLSTVVMMPKIKNGNQNSLYDIDSYPEWHQRMDEHIYYNGYRNALLSTLRYLSGKSFEKDYQALADTDIPSQLIWGINDQVVPLTQSKVIMNAHPKAALHTLEKTGHLPQIEQPEQVLDLLVKHINSASMSPSHQ